MESEPLTFVNPDFRTFDRDYNYTGSDILPCQFSSFPSSERYSDFQSFKKACDHWANVTSSVFNKAFLPIPMSLWYRFPWRQELPTPPGSIADLPGKGNFQLGPENSLKLQSIVSEGHYFNNDAAFPVPDRYHQPILIRDYVRTSTPWYANLYVPQPDPNLYSTYEEYRDAVTRWRKLAIGKGISPPPHPTEMEKILKIVQCEPSVTQLDFEQRRKRSIDFSKGMNPPTNLDLIEERLKSLRNLPCRYEHTNSVIDFVDEIAKKRVEYCARFREFSDFEEMFEDHRYELLELLKGGAPMSLCREWTVLDGLGKLIKSGIGLNSLFNDVQMCFRIAQLMNDFLVWPQKLFHDWQVLNTLKIDPPLEVKRQLTQHFYRSLLGVDYAMVADQFCKDTGTDGFTAMKMRRKPLMDQIAGLAYEMAGHVYEFLVHVVETTNLDDKIGQEILNLMQLLFRYVDNLSVLFEKFRMVDFLVALAKANEKVMSKLAMEILFSRRSCAAFLPLLVKAANDHSKVMTWPNSLIQVYMAFLMADPRISTPVEVSIALASKLLQVATTMDRDIFFDVFESVCFYTSRTRNKNNELVSILLVSCFSYLPAVREARHQVTILTAMETLIGLPTSYTFVSNYPELLKESITTILELTETEEQKVSTHSWRVLWTIGLTHPQVRSTIFKETGVCAKLNELFQNPPEPLWGDILDFACSLSKHPNSLLDVFRPDPVADELVPNRADAVAGIMAMVLDSPLYADKLNSFLRNEMARVLELRQYRSARRASR